MTMKGRGCVGEGVSNLEYYGMEDPWFCDDDAAALTGLKYAWAIASLAVNRSWIQGQLCRG